MHQALYRKWRPQTFDDVCGQEHITSILKYETDKHQFCHAYLFCGSRGTGKTTCAKILAKAVNCESPVNGNPCGKCTACRMIESGAATDVLEMDAASNNGVDNIRDIRDEVAYAPSALAYRVYIVDEVHMLSQSAFNALLKTLEEPPAHVIFILATTEMQKLPATIISRCQRFDFRRIALPVLMGRLQYIAKEESISLEEDAARLLAKLAEGGMRDAISLLELCAGNSGKITVDTVTDTVGISGRGTLARTVGAILDGAYDTLLSAVDDTVRSSKDLSVFWQDLLSMFRDLLVLRVSSAGGTYLDLTDTEMAELGALAARFTRERLLFLCKTAEDTLLAMQRSGSAKRTVAELALLRMCDPALDTSNEALAARLSRLEDAFAAGNYVPVAEPPQSKTPSVKSVKTEDKPGKAETAVTPPTPKTAAPAENARVLTPIRCWQEIAERLSASDTLAASFAKEARAYTAEDGSIIIQMDNQFSLDMLTPAKEKLRGAIASCLSRDVPPGQLVFEEKAAAPESTVLDELI